MRAPPYPLCDLELDREEARELHGGPDAGDWRDKSSQLGRAPFDSKFCAGWHALFESFAPVERALAPAYRFLLRSRGAKLRVEAAPDPRPAHRMAFDTVSKTSDLGATPAQLENVLRAYVEDIPPNVALTIVQRNELVGEAGQLEPCGVVAGMVFAMAARASYTARF